MLDNNLLVVIRELVNNVLVLLGELEVVEGSYALLGNGGTVGTKRVQMVSAMSQKSYGWSIDGALCMYVIVLYDCPAADIMVGGLCCVGAFERGGAARLNKDEEGISV